MEVELAEEMKPSSSPYKEVAKSERDDIDRNFNLSEKDDKQIKKDSLKKNMQWKVIIYFVSTLR